jgi:hypothetical protein
VILARVIAYFLAVFLNGIGLILLLKPDWRRVLAVCPSCAMNPVL